MKQTPSLRIQMNHIQSFKAFIKLMIFKISKFCLKRKNLLFRASVLCNILDKLPFADITGVKTFGFGMVQLAKFCDKTFQKVI